jgi:hypothetical protein
MCAEWDAKIRTLREQAADLVRDAREKRAAAQKLDAPIPHGGGGNHEGAQELYRQVDALAERARRIEKVEIPLLVAEGDSIRMGSHPEISIVIRNAHARVAAEREAADQALSDAYEKAYRQFAAHILELATPKTLELARSLDTASRAVKRTPSWVVRHLLTDAEAVSS